MSTRPALCIVGLGYVGLPLAHAFAKKGYETYAYDISVKRIDELRAGHDRTGELTADQLASAPMTFSADPSVIAKAGIVILAIPTPVDDQNLPDLSLIESATKTVGQHLQKGTIVVYESTVYPGVTEELCGPILEGTSGLTRGKDFTLGYSPERINPGDKEHTVETIVKIVAGEDEATAKTLADLYGSIVKAGIHIAPSIKVAEMAKAIENAQRDLNIAYVNEIAMLCNALGIGTQDVLKAAGTKGNFLKFQPGLVGGHCIGVDPYYLVEKARQLGLQTNIIASGRAVNDGMSTFIAGRVADALPVSPSEANILVLGLTFKENVPDTRNSKVKDVITSLIARGCHVAVHDPYVPDDAIAGMGLNPGSLANGPYHAILLLVPHREYLDAGVVALTQALADGGVLYDLKSLLDARTVEAAGKKYRSL